MNRDEIEALEKREQESGGAEGLGAEGYSKLLGSYLLDGELCHAKFLWKRVPAEIKKQPEVAALFSVAQRLWEKDFSGFFTASSSYSWPPSISPIVNQLIESVREKVIKLISTAYISIKIEDAAVLLGLSPQQTEEIARAKGWTIDTGYLLPVEESLPKSSPVSPEKQIARLSSFVSCLEN